MYRAILVVLVLMFACCGAEETGGLNEADVEISLGGTCDENDDNCQKLTFNVGSLEDLKQNLGKDIEKKILEMLGTDPSPADSTVTIEPSPTNIATTTNEPTTATVPESQTTDKADCPQSKLVFPNKLQTDDYVIINASIPNLTEVTVCFWSTPSANESLYGTMLSYATLDKDNAFLIYFEKDMLGVYLDKDAFEFPGFGGNTEIATCVITSISKNSTNVTAYQKVIDSEIRTINLTGTNADLIDGGGKLVLGQDQDALLGGFQEKDAFYGTIENLRLWNRTLDADEIENILNDKCFCPEEYIAYPKLTDQINGTVIANFTDTC